MVDQCKKFWPRWGQALQHDQRGPTDSPARRVLGNSAWKVIPYGTLLFVSAAVSIGAVGSATGMNQWLANSLLPSGLAGGIGVFALVAVGFCVIVHMCLGSTNAVMSITGPAIVAYGSLMGVSPIICAMLVYCAVALHWIRPFHHMNVLVGPERKTAVTPTRRW